MVIKKLNKQIKLNKLDIKYYTEIFKIKEELKSVFDKEEANYYNCDSERSKNLYKKFTPKVIRKIEKMFYYYSKISCGTSGCAKQLIEYRYINYTSNNMFNSNIVNIIYNIAQYFREEDKEFIRLKDIFKKQKKEKSTKFIGRIKNILFNKIFWLYIFCPLFVLFFGTFLLKYFGII